LFVENSAAERFWGKIPCQRVSSFLYYSKGGITREIIAEIKYKGNTKLGVWFGEWMAKEMLMSGFFEGIDIIIPVPLHKKKQRQRGYNQAEEIARGVGSVSCIPLDSHCRYRKTGNLSQTKKGLFERWLNTYDIFEVRDPEFLESKHILIIDDVLTTGSTLEACARSILKKTNVRISILTLAITL
jgi:ComF family protein